MNKTTIKKKNKPHKNSIQYRKLRRWVLPALLGAALSTLAFIPTLATLNLQLTLLLSWLHTRKLIQVLSKVRL